MVVDHPQFPIQTPAGRQAEGGVAQKNRMDHHLEVS
jgi:hypothetical protein